MEERRDVGPRLHHGAARHLRGGASRVLPSRPVDRPGAPRVALASSHLRAGLLPRHRLGEADFSPERVDPGGSVATQVRRGPVLLSMVGANGVHGPDLPANLPGPCSQRAGGPPVETGDVSVSVPVVSDPNRRSSNAMTECRCPRGPHGTSVPDLRNFRLAGGVRPAGIRSLRLLPGDVRARLSAVEGGTP